MYLDDGALDDVKHSLSTLLIVETLHLGSI